MLDALPYRYKNTCEPPMKTVEDLLRRPLLIKIISKVFTFYEDSAHSDLGSISPLNSIIKERLESVLHSLDPEDFEHFTAQDLTAAFLFVLATFKHAPISTLMVTPPASIMDLVFEPRYSNQQDLSRTQLIEKGKKESLIKKIGPDIAYEFQNLYIQTNGY